MIDKDFKILKVDHIAIATSSFKEIGGFFKDILQLDCVSEETIDSEKVKLLKFDFKNINLEVLSPTSADSPIQKFIKKNKTGVHHVSLLVDNIYRAILYFDRCGIRVIYNPPRVGALNKLITFLHPSDTYGVLIEISQDNI